MPTVSEGGSGGVPGRQGPSRGGGGRLKAAPALSEAGEGRDGSVWGWGWRLGTGSAW